MSKQSELEDIAWVDAAWELLKSNEKTNAFLAKNEADQRIFLKSLMKKRLSELSKGEVKG